MNTFDQAARYAARNLDAAGFLAWLFSAAAALWRWTGWVDTQNIAFPGEPDRRSDTVARFERRRGDAPPVAAVVEFMTAPRAEVYPRLAEYALRVHREVPFHKRPHVAYRVVTALIHLTGPAPNAAWNMAPDEFGDLGLWTRSRVFTFADVDARALFAEIARGDTSPALLAWVPLMKGADDVAVVTEWKRLVLAERDERKRRDYGGLAKVFAELTRRERVWLPGLEGLNVEESKLLKGRYDQGRKEGELRMLRGNLVRVLEVRFSGTVPTDCKAALDAQTEPDVLNRWFDHALQARTLDEVREAFGLTGGAPRKTPKRRR
jgi:hypothetical protein